MQTNHNKGQIQAGLREMSDDDPTLSDVFWDEPLEFREKVTVHPRKRKPYKIEYFPKLFFKEWCLHGRYRTEKQMEQAFKAACQQNYWGARFRMIYPDGTSVESDAPHNRDREISCNGLATR